MITLAGRTTLMTYLGRCASCIASALGRSPGCKGVCGGASLQAYRGCCLLSRGCTRQGRKGLLPYRGTCMCAPSKPDMQRLTVSSGARLRRLNKSAEHASTCHTCSTHLCAARPALCSCQAQSDCSSELILVTDARACHCSILTVEGCSHSKDDIDK